MLFLLLLLLLVNLIIAYKRFRYIISPPILMGSGMLLASFVSMLYYEEWEMYELLPETVFVIGGGTLFFTLTCSVLLKGELENKKSNVDSTQFDKTKILLFLYALILLDLIVCALKIQSYHEFFSGGLGISSLIQSAREDFQSGSEKFAFPYYIKFLSNSLNLCSNITMWILCFQLFGNNKSKRLISLCIIQLLLTMLDGLINGAKGGVYDTIARFSVIYIVFMYAVQGSYKLSSKFKKRSIIAFFILIVSFQGLNLLMGRDVEEFKPTDLLAAYCGAEIKNFDIYMHGQDGNDPNEFWGESTFATYYKSKYPQKMKGDNYRFLHVNNYFLGNVYTQFYSYHKDFGYEGVFVILTIIAITSMFMYNRAISSIEDPLRSNCWLLIYSMTAFHLLMSFFSARYTIGLFHFGFLRNVIFVIIANYFFMKLIKIENYEETKNT